MRCSITDLLDKAVIDAKDGNRIGSLCDVELDTERACLSALIIAVKSKNASFLGKFEKVRIEWCDIRVIGKDAILVDCKGELCRLANEKNFMEKLWN